MPVLRRSRRPLALNSRAVIINFKTARFTSALPAAQEVVIRSPARFTIVDRMNMVLSAGVLRAIVPSSAHGFTVHSSDVMFEDLGTEFGLAVGSRPGESQLHVFEGRVDLKTQAGQRISLVENGQSIRVTDGKVELETSKRLKQFPTPGAIAMEKWINWRERFEKDQALLCFYPFLQEMAEPDVLKDHAVSGKQLDGHIEGARWVTGRWPGKQALLFDRDGDHVKVVVPGEFRQLSLTAWVYLDRCDFALNALFNSDGWRPGALHWQADTIRRLHIGPVDQVASKTNGIAGSFWPVDASGRGGGP